MKVDQEAFSLLEIPKKSEYLKLIVNHNHNIHPMFKLFHDRKYFHKNKKDFIVNKSIRSYLDKYSHTLDLDILSEMIMSRQYNKVFVLWDLQKFHIETIDQEKFVSVVGIEGNSLIVKTPTRKYKLLLRWKNDNGVLNPAWQISIQ